MNKKHKTYGFKSLDLKVDDVDTGTRKVKGYLSAFNSKDSDDDIILPGSFQQSINLRGPNSPGNRKIAFLRDHNWSHQIGKFLELSEDEYGLKFVAQLGTSSKGEDALRDYDEGILREHSIGFNYVWDKMDWDEEKGAYMIKEVILWEGSGVTFGANENTPVLDVQKSLSQNGFDFVFEKINSEFTDITKALKNGKGSDDRLHNLEMRSRVLQGQVSSLLESLKANTTSSDEEKQRKLKEEKQKRAFLASIANV